MATDPNLAPETHNSEQDDEQSQAQTVAEQANALRKGDPTASVKHDTTETPDLVDHMRDMEASGRIDMSVDASLKIHDYAAFVPILEGAGGLITDWDGAPLRIDSGPHVLAAGDAQNHAAALAMIRQARTGARQNGVGT